MNRKQKYSILIGIIVITAMVCFPPWLESYQDNFDLSYIGFAPIHCPPIQKTRAPQHKNISVRVATEQLQTQIMATVIIFAALVFMFKDNRKED